MDDENKVDVSPTDDVADNSDESTASDTVDSGYDAVLKMLSELKTAQAQLQGQIDSLNDFKSVIIDSGATVRETQADDYDQTNANEGFVPIEELDLNI